MHRIVMMFQYVRTLWQALGRYHAESIALHVHLRGGTTSANVHADGHGIGHVAVSMVIIYQFDHA
jgi:hypothetical protein